MNHDRKIMRDKPFQIKGPRNQRWASAIIRAWARAGWPQVSGIAHEQAAAAAAILKKVK